MERNSKKRTAIYQLLCQTKSHPSAEWVYNKLKPVFPSLSLGTVYTNLAEFKASGKIISVGNVEGKERFDADCSPHAHFICRGCGAVLDVPAEVPPARLSGPHKAESVTLSYFGVCKDCLNIENFNQRESVL
ncbi:MAG: transcriptional repressor [Clostridium sp.]|nr:transcriptional repressor [Clostridium sp.]